MSGESEVKLLLVGRTGNGKSSTGNSILGQKVFNASMNSEPFTEADIRLGTRAEDHVTVVDGPGIGDGSLNDPDDVRKTISLTEKALEICSDGFNAVLLVLKYGDRFTTQEKDAVRMLKGILGPRVLENHGVVVMTQGDNFEKDKEEDGICFKGWCERQTGDVHAIFQECKHRVVLFDNRTKADTKLGEQRQELLKQVEGLGRYTEEDYDGAKKDRRRLKLESKIGVREETNRAFVDKTTAEINKLDISRNPNDAKDKIIVLQSELDKYRQTLQEKTRGTDLATCLLLQLDILAFSLGNKMEMATRTLALQEEATRDRRQRERDISKKSRNKEKKHKKSDAIEACPPNVDTGASSRRDRHSAGHSIQKKHKKSDAIEACPPNDDTGASSRRDRHSAGHAKQLAICDKPIDNPATRHSGYHTVQPGRNPTTTQSSQHVDSGAASDSTTKDSDRKLGKHKSKSCTIM